MPASALAVSRRAAVALLVLAAGGQAGSGTVLRRTAKDPAPKQDLSPTLKPGDFHKDFTHDIQPKVSPNLKFDHPYPEVQDEDTFDTDYPKDENHDGGEWHAQMDYDNARNLLVKKVDAERRAKRARDAIGRELTVAKKDLEHAEAAAARAAREVKHAKSVASKHDPDEDEDEDCEGESEDCVDGKKKKLTVDEAIAELEKRTAGLPDCEQQLADARAKLDKLLEGREEHEIDHAHETLEAKNDLWRAEKRFKKAEAHYNKTEARRAKLDEALAQEESKLEAASKDYDEKAALESQAQAQYDEAKGRLHRFRKVPEELDIPEHAHYDEEEEEEHDADHHEHLHAEAHSGAARPAGLAATLLAAVFAALFSA